MSEELAAIADELYGLDLGEFTAARNARAKQAKAGGNGELSRHIAALRKPSTAAWLVNQLGRHHRDELEQLLEVGAALRDAQANLDAGELKALSAQRRKVIAALGRQARALARTLGHPVGEAIVREVEETLHAAMVDAAAAGAVRTGRLVAALSPAGFGQVDLAGAVALPEEQGAGDDAAGPAPRSRADDLARRRARREAESAADEAHVAARQAEAELRSAQRAADDAADQRDRQTDAVSDLETQLERARAALAEAGQTVTTTADELDRAQTAAERADAEAICRVEALRALD